LPYYGNYHFAHLVCRIPECLQYERLIYHPDFLRFHTLLVDNAKRIGKVFQTNLCEHFAVAIYPGLLNDLDAGETSIAAELFKSGRREHDVIWQIIHHRMYSQIQAIARGKGTMEGIRLWVDLFNRFMEFGTASTAPSFLSIRFGDARTFAPYFLKQVLLARVSGKPCAVLLDEFRQMIDRYLETNERRESLDQGSVAQLVEWVQLYDSGIEKDEPEE
jgi:hypothetical protein